MPKERRRRCCHSDTVMSRRVSFRSIGATAITTAVIWFSQESARAQQPESRFFSLNVISGKVAPSNRTIKVMQGDRVKLQWTVDEALALHLHGYDVRLDMKAGEQGIMEFEAHAAGRYPVGVHGSGGKHKGALIYLEVHPR